MAVMEVLTGASVIITTVFAYLTWRMVSISQATLREVQIRHGMLIGHVCL